MAVIDFGNIFRTNSFLNEESSFKYNKTQDTTLNIRAIGLEFTFLWST